MVTPYEIKDQGTIEAKCIAFIKHAENSPKYAHQRQRAAIAEEFEQGKQWTADQYARWQEVGIEPITINRCLTTIKAITGMYLENLQDITVVPRKGGKEKAAQVITEVMKHSQDNGGYEQAAFQTFQQANITTAGYIFLDIDKQKSANGQLKFTSSGFFDVVSDPDCEEFDLDDMKKGAKYVIRKIYMDREILQAMFDDIYKQSFTDGRTQMENYIAAATIRSQFYNEQEKTYRSCLYECWWKDYIPAILLRDITTGETELVTKRIKHISRRAKKSRRLEVEKTFSVTLHRTYLVNGKMMDDQENPYGPDFLEYPCVRYVPIFRPNYERGVLDDITSLNFEENLRRTQVMRLLNVTANAGWKVGDGSDKKAMAELRQYGSNAGFIIDESKFGKKVEKIEPTKADKDRFLLAQQANTDIKEVTGINSATQGYREGTKGEPGVVLKLRKDQGEAANSSIFKNFKTTLELLGNKLLKILDVMDIYTEEEIRAIVQESHMIDEQLLQKAHTFLVNKMEGDLPQPQIPQPPAPEIWDTVRPEDKPAFYDQVKTGIDAAILYAGKYPQLRQKFDEAKNELAIQMLLASLKDGEVTQYGIKVILSPQTQTARLKTFEMLMALQDKYNVIPPDIMIEYSDVPNKDIIIARMRQTQNQNQQANPQPQRVAG